MIHKFTQNLWRWKCRIIEEVVEEVVDYRPSFQELSQSEWSPRFEKLMRNRMIMGSYRYGRLNANFKPQYDMVGSIKKRLKKYKNTGNTEHLIDIANMCLLEFEEGRHPNKHFNSIDDGEHTEVSS